MIPFNAQQKEAIDYVGGPLLVIAGAGSGKTSVIIQKTIRLIETRFVFPNEILAITFTNKAANEMKQRIRPFLNINSPNDTPFIGTFHAFCADILRRDFHHLDQPLDYVIFDSFDQFKLIKHIVEEKKLDKVKYAPQTLLSTIHSLKNKLIGPDSYSKGPDMDSTVGSIYRQYQQLLYRQKAVDFDDLLFWTAKLFYIFPEILQQYRNRYRYLLVDEYQDTNYVQYQIIRMLTGNTGRLTVVGDFDQNIYSWRGADIQNILNFEKDYPGCRVIRLEQNYRSTQTVLSCSNGLIQHNTSRKEKKLWTHNEVGDPILIYGCEDEQAEAGYIIEQIQSLRSKNVPLSTMAALFRTNAQSRPLEEALTRHHIPYRVVGGVKFLARKEIRDLLAYLRLIQNQKDNMAFERAVMTPSRGIGERSVQKWIESPDHPAFSLSIREKITAFFGMIKRFKESYESLKEDKIAQLLLRIFKETGYEEHVKQQPNSEDRLEIVYEFISLAREEELELNDFLTKVSLSSDTDELNEKDNAVTIMTLHSAKGLEFDAVFMPGMEEGLLPHYKSKLNPDELEEERRLCYVGMTRARKWVFLTYTERRNLFGEVWHHDPSRFLDELPESTVKWISATPRITLQESSPFFTPKSSPWKPKTFIHAYKPGDRIQHSSWGNGTILRVDGEADKTVLYITFCDGTKKLLAKYAPLTPVS